MRIAIINGPNLNLQGHREENIYGSTTFEQLLYEMREEMPGVEFLYFQSNIEGELIGQIQVAGTSCHGIIINAGGYSHTSVALHDALRAIAIPAVEVHISNIFGRERYRHHSLITSVCRGMICGLGMQGYKLAALALLAK